MWHDILVHTESHDNRFVCLGNIKGITVTFREAVVYAIEIALGVNFDEEW
jgi:hypothetical protein